jgi:hypothetical protein
VNAVFWILFIFFALRASNTAFSFVRAAMRTQSTALPTGAGRNKRLSRRFALSAMNRLQINRVKKEASRLIPIPVPNKKEILANRRTSDFPFGVLLTGNSRK